MRRLIAVLAIVVISFFTVACQRQKTDDQMQILPTDVPEGTAFQPYDPTGEWQIEPTLRIIRDQSDKTAGLAAVKIIFTHKATGEVKNVQAAVWLPDGVKTITPINVIGTNLEEWRITLTPQQPKFGVLSSIKFADYEGTRAEVRSAFDAPTRVKIVWDGGATYLEFPASLWTVDME